MNISAIVKAILSEANRSTGPLTIGGITVTLTGKKYVLDDGLDGGDGDVDPNGEVFGKPVDKIYVDPSDPTEIYVDCGAIARGSFTWFYYGVIAGDLVYHGERPDNESSDGLVVDSDWQTDNAVDPTGFVECAPDPSIIARVPKLFREYPGCHEWGEDPEDTGDDMDDDE